MNTSEKKNLAILFCSFRPDSYSSETSDEREKEYLVCLQQLARVIPEKRFDVIIADNTVGDIEKIKSNELRSFLSKNSALKGVYLFKENLGDGGNKGMGELQMLKGVMDAIPNGTYKNVSYVTARRLYTCPYVFERTDSMGNDILLSNPDFVYLDGKFEKTAPFMFNDMFFSMSESRIRDYARFSTDNMQFNLTNQIGSEQNLFRFVMGNKLHYDYLPWLGIIRNNWMVDFKRGNLENVQIC